MNIGQFSLEDRAKPVIKWAGGKSQLLSQLLPYFPKSFERYVEPFLGAGAVFLALNKKHKAHLNDSNPELFEMYQVIRNAPLKLMKRLDVLSKEYSEEFYYQLRKTTPRTAIHRASRLIFLNKTGFNGLYRQNLKGGFNVPFGKRNRCPNLYDKENILSVSKRLRKAVISNLDFERVLNKSGAGDFVYCDPPYAPLSSTSSFNSYTAGGFAASDQIRLKNACVRAVERGAVIAVSNSSAPLIMDLYRDWDINKISARRSINSKSHLRGKIIEVLGVLSQ